MKRYKKLYEKMEDLEDWLNPNEYDEVWDFLFYYQDNPEDDTRGKTKKFIKKYAGKYEGILFPKGFNSKLYRGVVKDNSSGEYSNVKEGQKIHTRGGSWTTSKKIATDYAKTVSDASINIENGIGFVVEYSPKPNEIVADLEFISDSYSESIVQIPEEKEVIILPSTDKFKVTKIIKNVAR